MTDDHVPLDPSDLPGFYRRTRELTGSDTSLRMRHIASGADAVHEVPSLMRDTATPVTSIVVVQDRTEIMRGEEPLKPLVHALLAELGPPVEIVELDDDHGLHTTAGHVQEVRARLRPGAAVLALGSGTVVDITKHAVFEFEGAPGGTALHLVSLATANSVCAYSSSLTVLTTDGVKRTIPSRLPDVLVLDTTTLADAPRAYTLGGIGDQAVAASSIADYRLANMLGMGGWEPAASLALSDVRDDLLRRDPRLRDEGHVGASAVARALTACGLAMSMAGESAPVSGLEHVTSHTLDMAARHRGRPIGNHGSQCGLATTLVLLAFARLLDDVDVANVDVDTVFPDIDGEREIVHGAFIDLDPSGRASAACWRDYEHKLLTWRDRRPQIEDFVRTWPERRDELRGYIADPREFLVALDAAGHPLRFEDVPPGIPADEVRWAFANARMTRKRLSVADVLYFFGVWDDAFVDGVIADFERLRDEVEAVGPTAR